MIDQTWSIEGWLWIHSIPVFPSTEAGDVFLPSLFANLSNGYFDHKSGTDKTRFNNDDPEFREAAWKIIADKVYWEGNSFDIGYLSERTGKILLAVPVAAAGH